MTFNINDKVTVRLTEYGKSVLAERDPVMMKYNLAADGVTLTTQFWPLMYAFGPCFAHTGARLPFETTITLAAKF